MIILAYGVVLVVTLWLLRSHFRGRSVEALIRNPPPGSDPAAIVSTLSYLEHELIKHRVPVLRSLMTKRVWNKDDHRLLARTIGRGESSMTAELQRYFEGVQRGAGRTLFNVARDPAFRRAEQALEQIQRTGERWCRSGGSSSPPQRDREAIDELCGWLSGPFRRYLVELHRSVYRCPITREGLLRSARRGMAEAGSGAELRVDEPPPDCIASILPADLDVVIRNLVRNAAQVELTEGRDAAVRPAIRPAIRIDVAELLEETGEESVLINVHDRSDRMLSTDDIYGRESSRGLGLVASALARHGGAVRAVRSTLPGFAKALQIRLARSLHEPDRDALAIARPGFRPFLYPGVAVVVHALLIGLLVIPYFEPHPFEGESPAPPEGCSIGTSRGEAELTVVCELFDDQGVIRSTPIRLEWPESRLDPGNFHRAGAACMAMDSEREGRSLAIGADACIREGNFEPSLTIRYASPWRRADYHVRVELRSSTLKLIAATRAAVSSGAFDRGRRLTDYLLGGHRRGLTPSQSAQVLYLRGLSAVIEGIAARAESAEAPSPEVLCELYHRAEQSAQELIALAEGAVDPARSRMVGDARYLLAQASIFLTLSMEGAVSLLSDLALGDESVGRAQTARFLLAVLVSEGALGAEMAAVDDSLTRLWQTYQRPPSATGWEDALIVELLGVSSDGEIARVPVPEALCAFRSQYPDVSLPAALTFTLTYTCGRRAVSPDVDDSLARLGRFIRQAHRPLACP